MICKIYLITNWKKIVFLCTFFAILVSGCLEKETPELVPDTVPPSVSVISPNGGEFWAGNSIKEIAWSAIDENMKSNSITLFYSIDSGNNWIQISSNEANDGSYSWDIPKIDSSYVKIKVEAEDKTGNTNYNLSTNNFTIDSTLPLIDDVTINDITLDSENYFEDGDDIKITATVMDENLHSGDVDSIIADLSIFGYNSLRPADSYDGTTATWILYNANHEPLNGTITATVTITAHDPVGLSSYSANNIRVYPLKVGIIEFAPEDVIYGNLFYYYDTILARYSIQNIEEYCNGDIIERYNFLEVFNNPEKQFFSELDFPYNCNPYSIYYIDDFFGNEAEKYGYEVTNIFDIDVLGPFSLIHDPPKRDRTTSSYELKLFFEEQANKHSIDTTSYDIIVFVYFHDQALSGREYNGFTSCLSSNNIALVCVDTSSTLQDDGVETIIHELTHVLGASDKYISPCNIGDVTYWSCCEIPDGIPEPDKNPLFPQEKACLMCGSIQLNDQGEGQNANFDDIVICTKTAEEIGWTN